MEINYIPVNSNKVALTNPSGFPIPLVFTSAWNFPSISEDVFLMDKKTGDFLPFLIVPLSEGTISVELASGVDYVIQEAEVQANVGLPLLYLVRRIHQAGTTVTTLTIGI